MKYCILGNVNHPVTNKPDQPYSGFVKTYIDGFHRNGIQLDLVNYKTLNIGQIKTVLMSLRPDFVFTHLTFHKLKDTHKELQMYMDVTKQVGTKFIHVCGDARTVERYMGDLSHVYHAALVNSKDLIKNCEPVGKIPMHYMPYASLTYDEIGMYDKSLDFKMPVFTGSENAHKDRKKFIEKLKALMEIKVIQTQGPNDLRNKTLDLSASSVILGLCTGYDVDGYVDVRPFQYLGAGAVMIMRKFKGMDELIPEDLYYSFDSYDDPQIVKQHWDEIQKTGNLRLKRRVFDYMQQHHSSKVRIKQIIDILKG